MRTKKITPTPILGFLRELPEVGSVVLAFADQEDALAVQYEKLMREAGYVLGEMQVLRGRAIGTVRAQWRADEIARASQGRVSE